MTTQVDGLPDEVDWLMDWLDAQLDAGRTWKAIRGDPYYNRLVAAMGELRVEKWGRCADCAKMTQTCVTELLATGGPVEVCPEGR